MWRFIRRRSMTNSGLEPYTTNVGDTHGAPAPAAGDSLVAYPAATHRATSVSDNSCMSQGMA